MGISSGARRRKNPARSDVFALRLPVSATRRDVDTRSANAVIDLLAYLQWSPAGRARARGPTRIGVSAGGGQCRVDRFGQARRIVSTLVQPAVDEERRRALHAALRAAFEVGLDARND